MRDTNRQRLYRAEQSVRAALKNGAKGGTAQGDVIFTSVADAQAWLNDTVEPLVQPHFDIARWRERVTIFEKPRSARTCSYYAYKHRIGLAPGWGFTGIVLCHEYSHHLTREPYGVPSHGGEFARAFLDVIELVYTGTDVHERLVAAYDKAKVIYTPEAQQKAARKQILRTRSDLLANYKGLRGCPEDIPTEHIVYAEDPSDFDGHSYRHLYGHRISVESTYTDDLSCGVSVKQLRYVTAPMVRWR